MYCLWNGEYGEHDLSSIGGLNDILSRQKSAYEKYIGITVGDFTCKKVEYDWGKRDQRWTCECNLCGKIIERYNAFDWKRGKGGKTLCDCRKEREEEEKRKQEEIKKRNTQEKIAKYIGKVYGDWKVTEYNGYNFCSLECLVCGQTRKEVKLSELEEGTYLSCNHRTKNDYSDPKWMGIRIGHLTSVRKDGAMYVTVCDCGRERIVSSSMFFNQRIYRDCGYADCPFANDDTLVARKRIHKGHDYELKVIEMLKKRGYIVEEYKKSRDYGVDLIVSNAQNQRIAIQCKSQSEQSGVESVQQIYSGGRYYGLDKFAIISEEGFSYGAMKMAKVLGVYLCYGKDFNYPEDIQQYSNSILPIYSKNEQNKKYYEIDGESKTLGDWCAENNKSIYFVRSLMNQGISLKNALQMEPKRKTKTYTVNGFTGTFEEVCQKYGIIPQTVQYRMKQRGMSLEEAVLTPKQNNGRSPKIE